MKKIYPVIILLVFSFQLSAFSFAAEEKTAELDKQIAAAGEKYFAGNKYDDFIDYLKSLGKKDKGAAPLVDYYIALARYNQLRYLEENQIWDEYFNKGNDYRGQITEHVKKAIKASSSRNIVNIKAHLLSWEFHKGQEDVFAQEALAELMNTVLAYSTVADDIKPIKLVADKLRQYDERMAAKEIYKAYVEKITELNLDHAELSAIALDFYNQGNLALAEAVYDAYIKRIQKSMAKKEALPILAEIAKKFAYKDASESDPAYAEKIFSKIEELGGKEALDEDLLYLRAYNLEKSKQFKPAKDYYVKLVRIFPRTARLEEANFKAGMISVYISQDIVSGKKYFTKLAEQKSRTAHGASSFYQLGLLAQWEGESKKAKEYYNKIIELDGDRFRETSELARKRLNEINEDRPIEYKLKTFLDISLKDSQYDMAKIELKVNPYNSQADKNIAATSDTFMAPSGCMQVELQYLWSGHLGVEEPDANKASFETQYLHPGTKEINLVVVSPAGIIDRSLDLIDIR